MFGKKIYNLSTLLILWIVIGLIVALINVIPEFKETRAFIVFLFCVGAYILAIIYIYKMWKKGKSSNSRHFFRLISILKTLAFLIIIPLLLINWGLSTLVSSAFSAYYFNREVAVEGYTLYIYDQQCFIPDSTCECDDYHSDLYIKNKYLGIMHYVTTTDYFIGDIKIENDKLIIKASDDCDRDIGKIKIIEL